MAVMVSLKYILLSNRNSVKPSSNVRETRDLTREIVACLSPEYICGFRMFCSINSDYFRVQL
jgi:hypothetical protein